MSEQILNDLESGKLRSAYKDKDGHWKANADVKQGILNAFKEGILKEYGTYVDKHNLMPRKFTLEHKVRMVPEGSAVRRGSYVAPGVIIMPPSYINVGAYVDEGSMVDSHVLVGSCAQIGKNVHLSAGVQIGGVLEPIGLSPVIIEDDCFIGAGSVIVEGICVRSRAVIAPGVILSKAIPIYDLVNNTILERGSDIPEGAVVIPGSRPLRPSNEFAKTHGLQINCPVIVKYRDAKSDSSLELEDALR